MQPAYVPQRLPETLSAKEIGAQMAQLRQQFNLTQQEVSERLHIRTRYVSAMEEGKLELLPGKVYARGYIHTYAEFLGLDPEQVVALCFASEPAAPPVTLVSAKPIPKTLPSRSMAQQSWRGYAIIGAVLVGALLLVTQLGGGDSAVSEEAEQAVAPVPEEMLQSVRNLVMPTPNNTECLTKNLLLSCFYADAATRDIARLQNESQLRFVGEVDLSSVALPVADAETPTVSESEAAESDNEKVPAETAPLDEEVPPMSSGDE